MSVEQMTDFGQLGATRDYVARNRAAPVNEDQADELCRAIACVLGRASPATMDEALAGFLANYVWNSFADRGEARGRLNGIVARARQLADDFYISEAEGVFIRDRPLRRN
jgi:hypothetical protein